MDFEYVWWLTLWNLKNKNIFTKSHYSIYSSAIKYNHKHLPSLEIEFASQSDSSYEVVVIHSTEGEGHLFKISHSSMFLYQEFFEK